MKKRYTHVYQFKITLNDISPPIWRRILVPGTYSFWDLHVVIQDAMGWSDYHLHEFSMIDPSRRRRVKIGIPDDEDFAWGPEILPGWKLRIAGYFSMEDRSATYIYDFGDGWRHTVRLEKIFQGERYGLPHMHGWETRVPSRGLRGPLGLRTTSQNPQRS